MSELDGRETEALARTPGQRLREMREASGLTRADIVSRTRVAERHIVAIEEDRFRDFASSTYAVGHSRAYARAVGLDEQEIASDVRTALAESGGAASPSLPVFEPGDPARVPVASVAWVAAVAALVVVAIVWALWPSYYSPAGSPLDLSAPPSPKRKASAPGRAPVTPVPAGGEVVFTATQPDVWAKFYDGQGNQLMQKIMAQGERYVVPPAAIEPQLWTARPDALAITVGGRTVAPLADRQVTVKDVPVSAAALLARPVPSASPPAAPASSAPGPAASTVSD